MSSSPSACHYPPPPLPPTHARAVGVTTVTIRFRESIRGKDNSGRGGDATPFEADLGDSDTVQDRLIRFDDGCSGRASGPIVILNESSHGLFDISRPILDESTIESAGLRRTVPNFISR